MPHEITFTGKNCGEVRRFVGSESMGCAQPLILDENNEWVVMERGQVVGKTPEGKWRVKGKHPRQIIDWSKQ